MIQIMRAESPSSKIKSRYGEIIYREWLAYEQARFEQAGRVAEIRTDGGRVSLWADRVAGNKMRAE